MSGFLNMLQSFERTLSLKSSSKMLIYLIVNIKKFLLITQIKTNKITAPIIASTSISVVTSSEFFYKVSKKDTPHEMSDGKSSGEAIGNPASMISTPSLANMRAISSFSSDVSVAPGDCSPSRRVVSKIRT